MTDEGMAGEDGSERRKLPPRPPDKVCGASTPDGPCGHWKGWGTPHPGIGHCRKHGGNTPNQIKAAEREQVEVRMRTYGGPIDIDPLTALLEELHRTAGHVAWLGTVVANLLHDGDGYEESISDEGKRVLRPRSGLKQLDSSGKFEKPSIWVELYQQERKHLAQVSKMAIDSGIEERMVKAAEKQADFFIELLLGILMRIGLSDEQQSEAQRIMAEELRVLAIEATEEQKP
jgi:hypothetical protein